LPTARGGEGRAPDERLDVRVCRDAPVFGKKVVVELPAKQSRAQESWNSKLAWVLKITIYKEHDSVC
jgi:hypothetical protein